jgi:prepilin peptidase CpaA
LRIAAARRRRREAKSRSGTALLWAAGRGAVTASKSATAERRAPFQFINHPPRHSGGQADGGRPGLPMLFTLALFIFPVLMAFAASSDLLTMRIANWLVLLLAGAYFALAFLAEVSLTEIGMSLAAAAIVLVVAFAFFAFGWIGGGDAKLVSATTLWVGFGLLLPYLIYAALLGGALTLLILAARRYPLAPWLRRIKWVDRLHDPKSGVPYGITLAVAGLLVYPQTLLFQHYLG